MQVKNRQSIRSNVSVCVIPSFSLCSAVVNALGSTPATFWVGLTDSDGSAIGALAKWNGATTAAVDAADYLTVDGVPSCGYYEPTSTNGINLRDCYQIPTDKPAGFLCEFCL